MLSVGGNLLTEVPESVGNLQQLQALILCDNLIDSLPASIARLTNLKSMLLHKNRLKHLPRDIIALKNLAEVATYDIANRFFLTTHSHWVHMFIFIAAVRTYSHTSCDRGS